MSNDGHCTGSASPSDCPFHLYRVSGDIYHSWAAVLANLEYTTPFLGQGGVHPPYPQDPTVRSRPGGWAYPDMARTPPGLELQADLVLCPLRPSAAPLPSNPRFSHPKEGALHPPYSPLPRRSSRWAT